MNKQVFEGQWRLGTCTIDFGLNRIRVGEEDIVIEPMVMQVLAELCKTPGEVVSHNTLVSEVWGSEHGTQERLVRAISMLRKVFRGSGREDGFIETIPKRGYRLTETLLPEEEMPSQSAHKPLINIKRRAIPLAVAALLTTLFFIFIGLRPTAPKPDSVHLMIEDFAGFTAQENSEAHSGKLLAELKLALSDIPGITLVQTGEKGEEDYRLSGQIDTHEDGHKIFVQLTRVRDEKLVWAESFRDEGPFNSLERAQAISRFLQARLGVGIGSGRVMMGDIDPEAYEHYLRGIALWAERKDIAARRKAIVSLRLAVERQPDFADAWARYGISLTLSHPDVTGLSSTDTDQSAYEALILALKLSPQNVRAHIGLSAFELRRNIDVFSAEQHARKAIKISPQTAEAHYVLAMTLLAKGAYQEAHLAFDRSISLDPQNVVPRLHKMASLAGKGDVEGFRVALRDCERCDDPMYHYLGFIAAMQSGSVVQAQEAIDTYLKSARESVAAGASQDSVSSRQEFEDLMDIFMLGRANEVGWSSWMEGASPTLITACTYAQIGENEKAIKMLQKMMQSSAFLETFELISHGGPLAFPDRFLQSDEYHALWESNQNMQTLQKLRLAKGRKFGLPN